MAKIEEVRFSKMHGAGNDYVYVCGIEKVPTDLPGLARAISDRHFGVGGDGLVVILPSEVADFRMRMFNADGSEAQMCGNASRCIAKYVYEKGLTTKHRLTLETLAGIKTLHLHVEEGRVESVTVDMGEPVVAAERVSVQAGGRDFTLTPVDMGNPHGVIFLKPGETLTDELVTGCGPALVCAPVWPDKANIEFAEVSGPHEIRMRVWERGSGETLACGTGACATVAAAVIGGLTSREVDVHLPGGSLHIVWDSRSGHLFMTGGATFVADGTYYREYLDDDNKEVCL